MKFVVAACHEAGHAVSAIELEVPFGCISLGSKGPMSGHLGGQRMPSFSELSLDQVEGYGIVGLSGVVGEFLCKDFQCTPTPEMVTLAVVDNPGDARILDFIPGPRADNIVRLSERAESILRVKVTHLIILATALVRTGKLTAAEAYEMLSVTPTGDHLQLEKCRLC